MKKVYLSLLAAAFGFGTAFGQGCTIDPSNTEFLAPQPNNFPCVERGNAFDNSIQLSIPGTITIPGVPIAATIDSVVITGITGFPTGLSSSCNPSSCAFPGGSNACINITGTTNDPTGEYTLTFDGYAKATTPLGAQTLPFSQLASIPGAPSLGYRLDVINPGEQCRVSGVKDFNAELNAAMSVFPNPNNGVFEFKLDAGRRVNGTINVVDVTGRTVFTQAVDAVGYYTTTINLSNLNKGIYTLQLRTAEGFASKNVSIQ